MVQRSVEENEVSKLQRRQVNERRAARGVIFSMLHTLCDLTDHKSKGPVPAVSYQEPNSTAYVVPRLQPAFVRRTSAVFCRSGSRFTTQRELTRFPCTTTTVPTILPRLSSPSSNPASFGTYPSKLRGKQAHFSGCGACALLVMPRNTQACTCLVVSTGIPCGGSFRPTKYRSRARDCFDFLRPSVQHTRHCKTESVDPKKCH